MKTTAGVAHPPLTSTREGRPAPKVLIAPDKFRGSLTAAQAAHAISLGVLDVLPEADLRVRPIADGGEGTVDALLATGAESVSVVVPGPLGDPVSARYARAGDAAYIEAAQSCGLDLIEPSPRTALEASTLGLGLTIRAAVESGARRVVVGLGGSATTDGGYGIAHALGFQVRDDRGELLGPETSALDAVWTLEAGPQAVSFEGVTVLAASDVDNRLLGPHGAAAQFGPQKGADPRTVRLLEARLGRWRDALARSFHVDVSTVPGGGAAGGIAAGLLALTDAEIASGASFLLKSLGIEQEIPTMDLVITGEGSLDDQSLSGKGPIAVSRLARGQGVPVLGVGGRVTAATHSEFVATGQIVDHVREREDPFADAAVILRRLVADLTRQWSQRRCAHTYPSSA